MVPKPCEAVIRSCTDPEDSKTDYLNHKFEVWGMCKLCSSTETRHLTKTNTALQI